MTGRGLRWALLCAWALLLPVLLAACGGGQAGASMEGVLAYRHEDAFYLYTEGGSDRIYTLPGDAPVSGGELAAWQRVRVYYDGSIREIYPPGFDRVDSVEILGPAEDEDYQKALDYFNTEIKPWHIDGVTE